MGTESVFKVTRSPRLLEFGLSCRANPTAPPVRSLAVDNIIDGIVPDEDQPERKRRQAEWQQVGSAITESWQKKLGGARGRAPAVPAAVGGRFAARLAEMMGAASSTMEYAPPTIARNVLV